MDIARRIDGIPVVGSTAERDTLFPTPALDQRVFNKETSQVERFNGTAWIFDLIGYPTLTGESSVTNRLYPYGDIRRFGAVPDAVALSDGVITSGSAVLTSVTAAFTAADVGKTIVVRGAGAAGVPLLTTIAGYNSANSVTLAVAASTTPVGAVVSVFYGTDSTLAIQRAVDSTLAMTGYKPPIILPAGGFLLTDTIHLGYGNAVFQGVPFEGAGIKYGGGSNYSGTAFYFCKADRQAFNLQGLRNPAIRKFSVIGLYRDFVDNNSLGLAAGAVAGVDDTLSASWNDTVSGFLDNQHSPPFAFSIDGYSGATPADPYPTGGLVGYNRNFTSAPKFQEIYVEGMLGVIVCQPCNADGNGDYLYLDRVYCRKTKYRTSIGNTQARSYTDIAGIATQCFAPFVNNVHGKQTGKFGGVITNFAMNDCIQLFSFGSFFAEPLTFDHPYGESIWRIGTLATAGATTEIGIHIRMPEFKFGSQNDVRGVPSDVFSTSGTVGVAGSQVDVKITGGHAISYPSVLPVIGEGVTIDGCYARSPTRTNANEWFASNATVGGWIFYKLQTPHTCRLKSRYINLGTGALAALPEFTKRWKQGLRTFGIPFWGEEVVNLNENDVNDLAVFRNPNQGGSVALTALANVSLVNKTLTFDYTGRTAAQFLQRGPSNGDPIWHDASGSVFFVRSVVGITVTADLQNNYKSNGAGGYNTINAFVTNAGSFFFRNSRIYTTSRFTKGDFTAANNVIAAVTRDDDSANSTLDAEVLVGDALMIPEFHDRIADPAFADITARSQAAKTITLNVGGAAAVRAALRKPLRFFIQPGPANR